MSRERRGIDDATARALDRATAAFEPRFLLDLARFGGLPGVRANYPLATMLADRVAASGRKDVERFLETRGEPTGHGVGPETFFAVTLAFVVARRKDRATALRHLDALAGDVRKPVRDAVVEALAELAAPSLVDELAAFTNGFLQASVALEALADRRVLERTSDDAAIAERVREAIDLAEHAGRAEERSQGRRRLLEAIAETVPTLAGKRPKVLALVAERAKTDHPEIRAAVEDAAARMKKSGVAKADIALLFAALDAATPALRDPTHYKGPTRGRTRRSDGRRERK